MNVKLIPNVGPGITDIQFAGSNLVMYLRTYGNDKTSVGMMRLSPVPSYQNLPYHDPIAFAVHQPSGQYAILTKNELIIGEIISDARLDHHYPLTQTDDSSTPVLTWSGDGSHFACTLADKVPNSLTGNTYTVAVVDLANKRMEKMFSTSEITHVSLNYDGSWISFQGHMGDERVDLHRVFEGWQQTLHHTTAHTYSRAPLRAFLNWNNHSASLHVVGSAHPVEIIASYFTGDIDRPPTHLVWAPNNQRLFANPRLKWVRKWAAYDFGTRKWEYVEDGELRPHTLSPHSFSPDGNQAVIITDHGPAIVTF